MRILYISQYFPPEAGASQTRAHELARNLVAQGHQVTMLAEIPNHPSGIIPPEYRGRYYRARRSRRYRCPAGVGKSLPRKKLPQPLMVLRILHAERCIHRRIPGSRQVRCALCRLSPLLSGGAGLVISRLRRIPMVFEVCDLWPKSAIVLGEMKGKRAIALATWLEEACYRRARKIVVVTRGIWDRLVERGQPPSKLALIPNGANTELFQFSPAARLLWREKLGLQDKFIALYAGLHGLAQGLETVVEAARQLQSEASIHFLLVGEGPCKADLIALADCYELKNITFLGEQPRENIPGLQSTADTAVIPLKNLPLFEGALPSKVFDAWACSRPIILGVGGEGRSLLESVQGGIYSPPEDSHALAQAVQWMQAHPYEREKMGANGRTYTVQNHSHPQLARNLAEILTQVISRA